MVEFLKHEEDIYHTEVLMYISELQEHHTLKCCTFHYNNILLYFMNL